MDFKTLHEDWKTLAPGPFTEPEDEADMQGGSAPKDRVPD